MKVYIVTSAYSHEGYTIEGVFSTREKAKSRLKSVENSLSKSEINLTLLEIQEWSLDKTQESLDCV